MRKNTLEVGERRLGRLTGDGLEDVAPSALLERTDDGVALTVTWDSADAGPVGGWFRTERRLPDLVDASEGRRPAPPKRLQFEDARGHVTLIGCRKRGYEMRHGGLGSGFISVDHVVFDARARADLDFEHVTGSRTTVTHLRSWIGSNAWGSRTTAEDGIVHQTVLPDDIDLGSWAGVQAVLKPVATDQSLAEGDLIQLQTVLRVETKSQEPVEWDRHLQVARALRDLLVMSGWHDETYSVLSVHHPDDTEEYSDGRLLPWWRIVASSNATAAARPAKRNHLITYGDLGVEGLREWFGLRDRFQRAVDPIVSSIRLRNVTAVTLLAQTGPGVEALGYELFLRDGMSKRKAKDVSLAHRLERILKDVADVLPFDGPEWARHLAETYNGIKHANRKLPDELDVLNVEQRAVLVVRAWCALQLGVPREALRARLRADPQSDAWVRD
jgi:hypothetical protein